MNSFCLLCPCRGRSFSRGCPSTYVFDDSLQFKHLYTVPSRSIKSSSLFPLTLKLISVFVLGTFLVSGQYLSHCVLCLGSQACCTYKVAFLLRGKRQSPTFSTDLIHITQSVHFRRRQLWSGSLLPSALLHPFLTKQTLKCF